MSHSILILLNLLNYEHFKFKVKFLTAVLLVLVSCSGSTVDQKQEGPFLISVFSQKISFGPSGLCRAAGGSPVSLKSD